MEKQVTHKPGVFKQPNKTHKTGRHRSKGDILKTNKGKTKSCKKSVKKVFKCEILNRQSRH